MSMLLSSHHEDAPLLDGQLAIQYVERFFPHLLDRVSGSDAVR
jgi:hypothetical protein